MLPQLASGQATSYAKVNRELLSDSSVSLKEEFSPMPIHLGSVGCGAAVEQNFPANQ